MWQSNRQYISLHFIFLLKFLDHLSPGNNTIKVLFMVYQRFGREFHVKLINHGSNQGFVEYYTNPCS